MVRLRLTGPKSHALLVSTFELFDWSTERSNAGSRWWEVYSKGEDRIKMLEEQNKSWEQMKVVGSPGVLKAGSVVALVVKDPRLGLPVRKSSVDMASEDIYKGWRLIVKYNSVAQSIVFRPPCGHFLSFLPLPSSNDVHVISSKAF